MRRLTFALVAALIPLAVFAGDANRLAYLDENNPYYPNLHFPKLTTPMWVGEDGVDAVVILAIDDMRDPQKYEAYLRPILNRLKKIDGRAPVSIMTCQIDPKDPQLQMWLKEGLSLECHTVDHPCPLLQKGDFAKAKSTYDRCVDLMNEIPGTKPVAFRVPCCDSLNTVSPRFFAEIFNKTTAKKNFLQIDSSVFNLITADDPALPRELVLDPNGRERFRKYLPTDRTFVNYIENYPYPYVINRLCWEFPCAVPSDWAAQHLHKPNNPITVRDWKAYLDAIVIKQGVFNLVFHPHGWIKADQIIDLIDYAESKYGKRVKFLTFKEALERLNTNVLGGSTLRDSKTGTDNGISLFDVTHSGYAGVLIHQGKRIEVRNWDSKTRKWTRIDSVFVEKMLEEGQRHLPLKVPLPPQVNLPSFRHDGGRLIDLDQDGQLDIVFSNEKEFGVYLFTDMQKGWSRKVIAGKQGEPGAIPPIAVNGTDNGFFVHGRTLYWQNEHTSHLKDLVDKRSFDELLRDVEPTAKSPEASLKCIKTAPGFRAELMAAEPLVQDPVAFAWGPDGRLWVVEMGDYPEGTPFSRDRKGALKPGALKPGGRVKFLEDTNGDGKYDKATVFLDNLGYPNGVLPWRKGVLVTCAPDIFYAEDTDGDGKADKREVLFTGFPERNPQHRVNGLVWGLDGWVYVADVDAKIVSTKRKQVLNCGGRDLRIRPDTGEMEAESGQSQFGRTRDDWGNWFGNNNSVALWHYVISDHYLKRNPHVAFGDPKNVLIPAGTQVYPQSRTLPRFNDPHTANRFTSACSPMIYRDDLMFPALAHASGSDRYAFVSEPVHNLVHRVILTQEGMTFRAHRALDEERSEFVASTDNWFRPTMLQTGPDGCLWIADMYRAVIEHPQWIPPDWQKKLDLRAGHDMGRLYRIVPVDKKPRAIPRLDKMTTAELVAALDSPNGWQRDMAMMMLLWKGDPAAVEHLERLAASRSPLARMTALCTLDAMGQPNHIVEKLLDDPHPGVRRHAARIVSPRPIDASNMGRKLASLASDPDPQVRLQAALTLHDWPAETGGKALGTLLATGGNDRFLRAAVLSSIQDNTLHTVIRSVLKECAGQTPAGTLEDLLHIAIAMQCPEGVEEILRLICTPSDTGYSAWQWDAMISLLNALDTRGSSMSKLMEPWKEHLRDSPKLIAAMFDAARKMASDEKTPIDTRSQALRLLGRMESRYAGDAPILMRLLAPRTPPELQSAAVAALGRRGDVETAKKLLAAWKGFSPARRTQVLELLLRREETTRHLMQALRDKSVEVGDLDAQSRQRLLTHTNVKLRQEAQKLLEGTVSADRQKVIDAFRPAITLRGKPETGKEHFTKLCAACHKLGSVGNPIGPDLAALASKPGDYLLTAILDPNRAVESRYIQYLVELKNGQSFAGLLFNETSTSLTVAGIDGKAQTILRANVDSLTSTGRSQMPEGLEKDLKPQDFADLLAFLKSSAPALKRKEFPGNKPEVQKPFPGGELRLDAHNAEIYGPTLVFESKYGNLGYWQSADDHAAWEIELPKAGRYEVRFEYACDPGTADNRFELTVADSRLTGVVASTGSWDTYRWTKVGEVSLPAGRSRVVIRPDGPLQGALIDLRNVRFAPVTLP